MILRPGNLVRHKSGGPIMMIDDLIPREQFRGHSDFMIHTMTVLGLKMASRRPAVFGHPNCNASTQTKRREITTAKCELTPAVGTKLIFRFWSLMSDVEGRPEVLGQRSNRRE